MPEHPLDIMTQHLRLHGLSLEEARLAVQGEHQALAARIGAHVPANWIEPALPKRLPGIVTRMAEHPEEAEGWVWVVIDRQAGAVVGDIGFHSPVRGRESVEIGYLLFEEARGRGFATEAAGALMTWALEQPGIERVTMQVEPENAASLRVAEKLRMRETTPEDPRYRCFERLQAPEPREGETP